MTSTLVSPTNLLRSKRIHYDTGEPTLGSVVSYCPLWSDAVWTALPTTVSHPSQCLDDGAHHGTLWARGSYQNPLPGRCMRAPATTTVSLLGELWLATLRRLW